MGSQPPEPQSTPAPPPAPAMSPDDPNYHCPNCLSLVDPSTGETFWACQNLCIRE